MGAELITRLRHTRDLDACADILIDVHRTDGYPVEGVADPRAWLQPPGLLCAWVAELRGDVVGHVAVTEPQDTDGAPAIWKSTTKSPEDVVVLGRLFVHSRARGQHAGTQLITAATEFGAEHNRRLVLDVMRKDRAAIALYEKLGWTQIGTLVHEFGDGNTEPALAYIGPS